MKKYLLPLILILLLTFTLIGNCAWLSGYDQRIKLTIDNTKIDGALSNFPVTVFFDSAQGEEIFNEFDADADYMKCAFTTSDGTTQLYAEKELFSFNVSQYPPAQSDTYVKSTTKLNTSYWAYYATDPAKSLTGGWEINSWIASSGTTTNQRFHIDLGSTKVVKRIYYENQHDSGTQTDTGVQNFTFWGSNTGAGTFDDLVYANDEGWTQLTISQSTFDQHTASDVADPKYITVTNTTAYRYYAFKFADNYGDANYMGVRRIELQAGEAIYHVKVTSVASDADTEIYYYYDNDHADNTTYIGAINTTAGGTVWDSNFKAVYHMVDATTSTIVDSTSNNNDGTKVGANEPIEAIGKVYKGQDFDTTNDYINCGGGASLNITGNLTIEAIIETDQDQDTCVIVGKEDAADDRQYYLRTVSSGATSELDFVLSDDGSAFGYQRSDNDVIAKDIYYHVASVYTAGGTPNVDLYVDGTEIASTATDMKQSIVSNESTELELGSRRNGTTGLMDGIIDEVRISASVRNAAWIKATYNSLWDTLLTYGSEEEAPVIVNVINFGCNF